MKIVFFTNYNKLWPVSAAEWENGGDCTQGSDRFDSETQVELDIERDITASLILEGIWILSGPALSVPISTKWNVPTVLLPVHFLLEILYFTRGFSYLFLKWANFSAAYIRDKGVADLTWPDLVINNLWENQVIMTFIMTTSSDFQFEWLPQ